jgi:hypothetical protein
MPLLVACCLAAGLAAPPLATGLPLPQVTHIEANNGPQAGGATVAISGVGFLGPSPARTVSFGARPSPKVMVVSDTLIEAVAPPGAGEVEVRVTSSRGEASPEAPADRYAYDPPPSGPWLGLNGNSQTYLGPLETFVEHRVLYDRSGAIEWGAGETVAQGQPALGRSLAAGMIPVLTIEFPGYSHCAWESECLPSGAAIGQYVSGFVSSAKEVLAKYPAAGVLFEAINEPWGYGTAAQYAAILAQLLPAAARAGLPLSQIYAGAVGGRYVHDLYKAQPQLQSEVKGWYLHPYDRTRSPGAGVASVPGVQSEMTSGQNNIVLSELGFCAPDVNRARRYCSGSAAPAKSSRDAAGALTSELLLALPFRQAGWLKALIVYSRNDAGWAMQVPGGGMTRSGEALEAFADLHG